jgi:hypothetical protein
MNSLSVAIPTDSEEGNIAQIIKRAFSISRRFEEAEMNMPSAVLSVVIPAYNEEGGIAQIIERVLAIRPRLADAGVDGLEVIVVDDGSRDDTAAIADRYPKRYPEVRLIPHSINRGYGAALKTGFSQARGNLLGFLDADGTYPPEHFPELCRVALAEKADLVIGSRMAGADSEMPMVRRIGNWIFANLVSLLGNHRVSDSSSGMRVIRREALPRLYPLPDGLNFTPVMSTRALYEDVRWREVPIPYTERVGRSKLSVVRDGTRFLCTIIWTALGYNPVRVLGGIGLGLVTIAGLIAAAMVGMGLSGTTRLGPSVAVSIFMASILATAGMTLLLLGVPFRHLVGLFHKRTTRQGLFGKPVIYRPPERRFGWTGLVAMALGLAVGIGCLSLSPRGWPFEHLWRYLVGEVMLLQLAVFWVITRMLAELNQREPQVAQDLACPTQAAGRKTERGVILGTGTRRWTMLTGLPAADAVVRAGMDAWPTELERLGMSESELLKTLWEEAYQAHSTVSKPNALGREGVAVHRTC